MSQDCKRCTRPVQDGTSVVCGRCVWIAEEALRDVPDLCRELFWSLTRQTNYRPTGGEKRPGTEQPLPFDAAASELRFVLQDTLRSWMLEVWQPTPDGRPVPGRDQLAAGHQGRATADMSRWLLTHLPDLRRHAHADKAVDEIEAIVKDVREHILGPKWSSKPPVGPCPEDDEHGQACTGEVLAYISVDGDDKKTKLRCTVCGTDYPHNLKLLTYERIHNRMEQNRRAAS